jgi:hypothetical protein
VILVARISPADVRGRVRTLRTTVEGVTANLVELDADVTRQLLEASTGLAGKTATAWSEVSTRLTRLWQGQQALEQVLARIDVLQGGRRSLPPRVLEAIADILQGPSVELPAPPDHGRRLTADPHATESWTIDAALDLLSNDYDAVIGAVTAVGRVWGELSDGMVALAAELSDVERLVHELDLGLSNELAGIRRALDEARAVARTDPLDFDGAIVVELSGRVHQARHVVDEAMGQRAVITIDCDSLDSALARALALLEECRGGRRLGDEKVVVPVSEWAARERDGQELERLQAEIRLARRNTDAGAVKRLRAQVDAVLSDLGRLSAFAASGVVRRDELRGLLEAYRAKAQAIGVEERPETDRLYGQLREVLYSAPCDVEAADMLLADYRRAIAQAQSEEARP